MGPKGLTGAISRREGTFSGASEMRTIREKTRPRPANQCWVLAKKL